MATVRTSVGFEVVQAFGYPSRLRLFRSKQSRHYRLESNLKHPAKQLTPLGSIIVKTLRHLEVLFAAQTPSSPGRVILKGETKGRYLSL